MTTYTNDLNFARKLDKEDSLKNFRDQFFIPQQNGKDAIYFCGNSLGLQPKSVKTHIDEELLDWSLLGVEGHIKPKNPWVSYHKLLTKHLTKLTGGKEREVVAMNSLTVNLHLALTSFYRPDTKKYKIITEAGSFSSDIYALESQVKLHGLDPAKAIIKIYPREGEFTIHPDDILDAIERHGDELALVLFGAVNYYTGQAFDMKGITKAAHLKNAKVGFDLAHAIGNIGLQLHDWKVDFAVWCSYKYLNSGPGGVGGLFIHEKYAKDFDLPRMTGWWGNEEQERFLMKEEFRPMKGAEGWQLSNAPVLSMAAQKASLEIFEKAGIKTLLKKSRMLTGYLEYLISSECRLRDDREPLPYSIKIITPRNKEERGAQLSILIKNNSHDLYVKLKEQGFIVDWRSPSVIRVAPVPLYNTFEEVYKFSNLLAETCCHE